MLRQLMASDLARTLKRPVQVGLGVAVLTALLSLLMPNQYRSEARILPVETKTLGGAGLGSLTAAAAAFGVSLPGGDASDANFLDILNSRTLRERLLQTEFTFHARSWRFGREKARTETLYAYLEEANIDRAVRALGGRISVSRDMKSKVITLAAETPSPELSQKIVQESLRLLEAFVQQKGRTRGSAKAAFAEARLAEARREMAEAEDAFRRFLDSNRNYTMSFDPDVRLKGLRLETELKLRQQLVTTLALNREQALMEEKNDMPILSVLDPGNLPVDKSRPGRSVLVLNALLLAGAAALAWQERRRLLERLKGISL